jgi:hypothetical protein
MACYSMFEHGSTYTSYFLLVPMLIRIKIFYLNAVSELDTAYAIRIQHTVVEFDDLVGAI